MGSRLHGNDGRRRRTPQSSFPQQRESTAATSSFPRRRESTAGGRRWVPVSTGTTDGGGAPHNRHSHNSGNPRQPHRHSRDGGNPRRGAGDGFPSPRERRTAAAHPTIVIPTTAGIHGSHIVIPATAGIHGGGPAMGSRLHGNDGRRRRTPQSSFPQQRESTAATSSFPRRRESTAGGRRWVPVSTGTTDGGGAFPQRGTIVIPATAGIHPMTWCAITTPEAVRHAVLPSQLVNLGRIGVVLAGCLPYA